MSGSTSKIIYANGSTTEESSELNISKKIPLEVEEISPTDQSMDISDSESTVTIGEISADEYYDEIIFGRQSTEHKELYSSDQNIQSGSSNYANVVNNNDSDDSDYDGEDFEEEDLISYDISLALPTIHEHRHNWAHTREHTLDQSHEQPTHQSYEHMLENNVCHRPACNKIVMPSTRRIKPRAAAIEASAKIAKFFTKRKQPNNKRNGTAIYYSCGHREKIGCTSLKHIGIKTPTILKESRLLDERLMKTTCYVLKLPAELTVHQILHDFQRKANSCVDFDLSMDLVFTAFNHALPAWCLYSIEKLQYDEIIKKYPNRQVSELYGLAHLLRFIVCLPRLYNRMRPHHTEFNVRVTAFMNELMDYLVEKNLRVDIEKDYEHVMPEYHRLTYWHIQNQI